MPIPPPSLIPPPLPPLQSGECGSRASDLYSIGVVLYSLHFPSLPLPVPGAPLPFPEGADPDLIDLIKAMLEVFTLELDWKGKTDTHDSMAMLEVFKPLELNWI